MTMHGNKPYTVKYANHVITDDIPALSKTARELIKHAIEQRIAVNPLEYGKPMQHSYRGHRRLRVSDYRVIYRIDKDSHTVYIVAIGHRKDVYRK